MRNGHFGRAQELLEEGLVLARACGDQASVGRAMFMLSLVFGDQGEYEQAVHWGDIALAFCRERGDWWGVAAALTGLLLACLLRPAEYERGRMLGLEGLALSRQAGNPWAEALFLDNLGWLAYLEGKHGEARDLASQGRALAEQTGDRAEVAEGRMLKACLCLADGLDEEAWTHLRAALREAQHTEAFTCVIGVGLAAQLSMRMGLLTRAAELASLALSPPGPVASWLAERALSTLRQALLPDELEAALARGRELDLEQTVQELLAAADEQAPQIS